MSTAREMGERIKDTIRREGILRKDTEFAIDSLVRLVSLAQPGQGALTDKQIDALWLQCSAEVAKLEREHHYEFASWFKVAVKLVEAHHGITSTPTGDSNG